MRKCIIRMFMLLGTILFLSGCWESGKSESNVTLPDTFVVSEDDFRPLFDQPGSLSSINTLYDVLLSPDHKKVYGAVHKKNAAVQSRISMPQSSADMAQLEIDALQSSTNLLQIMSSALTPAQPPDFRVIASIPNVMDFSLPVFCSDSPDTMIMCVIRIKGEPVLLNWLQVRERYPDTEHIRMQADPRFERKIISLSVSDGKWHDIADIPLSDRRVSNMGSMCSPTENLLLLNYGNKIFKGTRHSSQTLVEIYPKIKDEHLFLEQIAYNPAEERIYLCQANELGTENIEKHIVAIDLEGNVHKKIPLPPPTKSPAVIVGFFDVGKKCVISSIYDGVFCCNLSEARWVPVKFPEQHVSQDSPIMRFTTVPNGSYAIVSPFGADWDNPFFLWNIREFGK